MYLFSHSEINRSILEADFQNWCVYFETREEEYDLII